MANLITIYYTDTIKNTNKNLIPGDVIIQIDYRNCIVIDCNNMVNIYIADKKRKLVFVTNICPQCYRFHISDYLFNQILGTHWKKYKQKYWRCGIPISNRHFN